MRVLILVDCYLPTRKSSAKLVHELGMEMVRLGHSVTICAPSDGGRPIERFDNEGLGVVRIRTGKLKGASRVLRGLREARLASVMWKHGRRYFQQNPFDLIVFYSPSIFFGPLVLRLKRLWNCPAYLVLRDIWPQFLLDTGALRKGVLYGYLRHKEMQQNEAADIIGIQSSGDRAYVEKRFPGAKAKIEVLNNWAKQETAPNASYRGRLGLDGKIVLFYGGNFGIAQDMDNLLRLAQTLLSRREVVLLLVGDGSEFTRVAEAIRTRKLTNVRLMPSVSQSEYVGIVSEMDVGLLTLDRRFKIENVPGKFMAYLNAGIPVLASVNRPNDLFDIIHGGRVGFCCANGDDQTFTNAAIRLIEDIDLRVELGKNGIELLKRRFSVQAAAEQILGHWTITS